MLVNAQNLVLTLRRRLRVCGRWVGASLDPGVGAWDQSTRTASSSLDFGKGD